MQRKTAKASAAKKTRVGKASPGESDSAALAAYIADMTAELSVLAGKAGMPMLCYFLNLARVEADLYADGKGGGQMRRPEIHTSSCK